MSMSYRPTRWSADTDRATELSSETAIAMTCRMQWCFSDLHCAVLGVHALTGFDMQLARPEAFPADAFDRALLCDVAVFPQLHAAVLV